MIHEADQRLRSTWGPRFNALPDDAKEALRAALMDLREDALKRAEYSWRKHKAPMALYWKVVGVYAGHLARTLRPSAHQFQFEEKVRRARLFVAAGGDCTGWAIQRYLGCGISECIRISALLREERGASRAPVSGAQGLRQDNAP